MDAYVNPENNHLILIHENGEMVDTNITLECDSDLNPYLPPYPRVCLPKYRNSFICNIQNTPGHFTVNYTSGEDCDMGQLCEVQLIIFSLDEPPIDCKCPLQGYILYINLIGGNVYVKEVDSDIYLYIGNIHVQTIGRDGPSGLNVDSVKVNDNYIYTCFENDTFIQIGPIDGITGPTGPMSFTNNEINSLRQPYTFHPTCFGTGLDNLISENSIVFGNHNNTTGPNNANYTVAIGYHSGQINQLENSIAIGQNTGYSNQYMNSITIGKESGFSNQGTGAIAIGRSAGYTDQGQYAIAIGYQAGITGQAANSIVLSAGGTTTINNTVTNSTVVYPIRNVNGTSSTQLYWDTSTYEVTYGTEPSSMRYKENVIDLPRRYIDDIYKLRPVEFTFKSDLSGKKYIGFIAEDVNEIIPEVVIRNATDENIIEGIDYDKLVVPLIEIIKEYKIKLSSIENDIYGNLIDNIGSRISTLEQYI
jgi:hypothetical protein